MADPAGHIPCPQCAGTLLWAGRTAQCFDCGVTFFAKQPVWAVSLEPEPGYCVVCRERKPLTQFMRFGQSGSQRDQACLACRVRLREREQARRTEERRRAEALAQARALEAARVEQERVERERERARAFAEAEAARRAEQEARAAESRRAAEEAAAKQREEAARAAEAARIAREAESARQAAFINVLAVRAATWPGASEEQVGIAASTLLSRMVGLADQLQADFARAAIESKAADVGSAVAGVAGGVGAVAGVLGRVHPLLGVGGFVLALAAKPLGAKVKQTRGNHYVAKWQGIVSAMRQPEQELFAAVLGHRHPTFCSELQRISLLR